MGLSFTIPAGHRQHSHSQVRDCPNLEGQFPVSYIPRHWVPFSSPPTTRRATVEVFDPASTVIQPLIGPHGKHAHCLAMDVYCFRVFYLTTGCLHRICLGGKLFMKPLPSNGSMLQNINNSIRYNYEFVLKAY
jgi:hypothetical protein